MKKRILIVTSSPLHNGPRLIREIDALKDDFDIVAVGSTPPHDRSISYVPLSSIKFTLIERIYNKIFRQITQSPNLNKLPFVQSKVKRLIEQVNPDIVIIHSPIYIPYFINHSKKKFKLVFNAHEFHPLEFESDIHWMHNLGVIYAHIYKNYLTQVDLMINVCDSIAERCRNDYGIDSLVVPNAAYYHSKVNPVQIQQEHIKLVHHGAAIKEREIELMIEATLLMDDHYSLYLVLTPADENYLNGLKSKYKGFSRIHFVDPVSFDRIIPFINQFDIGIFNLPPKNYNYLVALPNKLFEFVQARLCIVVSPSPEMKSFVEKHNVGVVSDSFSPESFKESIAKLTPEMIMYYKNESDKKALELSNNSYRLMYLDKIKKLIS